ncbi:MAG: hypothetical protein Q9222_001834 [Ikaeria aurantiellina]
MDHSMPTEDSGEPNKESVDDWCTTHIDHGCLTGLTSAVYIDESAFQPTMPHSEGSSCFPPPTLASLPSAPDAESGLYIQSRVGVVTKVAIPPDCLAFQTGETLQLITEGKFQAVPHFVRSGRALEDGSRIARNTLAVFTQPGLDEVVDQSSGKTYAEFCHEVAERFN